MFFRIHGFANFSTNNGLTGSVSAGSATADQLNALNAVKLTNDYIAHEHGKDGMFATMFFGVINPFNGIMAYINAGHEPLSIVDSAGVKKSLNTTGPAVGMMINMKFDIQQIQFEPGDILIGYTDGVIEADSPTGDLFTRNQLLSVLDKSPTSAAGLIECIKSEMNVHIQNAQLSDDITMLAVQLLNNEEAGDHI